MFQKVPIGRIVRAHGLKGEVKVLPYALNEDLFEQLTRLYYREKGFFVPLEVVFVRKAPGGGFLIKFEGVTTREGAEALKDVELWADVADFPALEEGEYYHYQLIGLEVRQEDGTSLGTVRAIMPVGPYDLLEVSPPQGKSFYLPMIDEIILEIRPEEGYLLVRPTKGLLEAQR